MQVSVVPPVGFEPTPPPPETGRSRDRRRLLAFYLGFCSRLVSLVASHVLWFVPRDIPRRVSSLDDFETLVLLLSCEAKLASGRSRTRQHAAIRESSVRVTRG